MTTVYVVTRETNGYDGSYGGDGNSYTSFLLGVFEHKEEAEALIEEHAIANGPYPYSERDSDAEFSWDEDRTCYGAVSEEHGVSFGNEFVDWTETEYVITPTELNRWNNLEFGCYIDF